MTTTSMISPAVAYRAVEHAFDAVFGAAGNPLKQLGALATGLFCVVAATGIVLYVILDTSVEGAWRSVDALTRERGSPGSLLRGLHRYAADAFVLVTLVHLAREWVLGCFHGFRRFSWLTGVVLLPLALAAGVVGFWLNWDRLAQYAAVTTAEWLDALAFLGSPLARNFLTGVSDRLFSLLVFVHLGVPLLLVFGLWCHVQRLARPQVVPRLALALGTMAALLALALAWPVRSHAPADLGSVPDTLSFDWIVLAILPLAAATSPAVAWLAVGGVLALLFGLPFTRPRIAAPAPVVDPAHCNGCRRCLADCPYNAITMIAHPNGRPGQQLPHVDPMLCASCGLCVGACPSATSLRRAGTLACGIDLPQFRLDALRRRVTQALREVDGAWVVFGCERGADVRPLASATVLPFALPCAGVLPPSFVEHALREGAAGVLVVACREGGCDFRFGADWTAQRLAGEREPHLRRSVPRERWQLLTADAGEEARVVAALAQWQQATGAIA